MQFLGLRIIFRGRVLNKNTKKVIWLCDYHGLLAAYQGTQYARQNRDFDTTIKLSWYAVWRPNWKQENKNVKKMKAYKKRQEKNNKLFERN